ncbi:MAG TPA: 2-hydroxyacid dehydrogenase [Marmoricola sp.]|nr:2-hydroxyacid dehydrogenase [Marmoricola sp.]
MHDDTSLVWLPLDVAELAVGSAAGYRPPHSLRFEVYDGGEPPGSIADVVFWSPMYDTRHDWDALFAQMTSLRVVQLPSAGYEHVEPHLPAGVTLCNGRGLHDAATAEWVVALVLAGLRDLPSYVHAQGEQRWTHRTQSTSLADSTVLILGYGSIGQALHRRLEPFECTVVPVASRARDGVHGVAALEQLLPGADVVVVLTPLNEQTRGLVDAAFLARMRDGALLVNVARGGVVDTAALLAEGGRIRAALDVTDPEPLPPGHPLWTAPDVLVTPHVAGGTTALLPRLRALLRAQLDRFAAGRELLNRVD